MNNHKAAVAFEGVMRVLCARRTLCARRGWWTEVIAGGGGSRTGTSAALPEHPEGIKLGCHPSTAPDPIGDSEGYCGHHRVTSRR